MKAVAVRKVRKKAGTRILLEKIHGFLHWKKQSTNVRIRASVGVSDALEEGVAAPLSGAAVTLTNFDPQEIDNCCAADVYVLLKGCVELLAKFAKIAMESCRHELQVGREPPGSSWPIGR